MASTRTRFANQNDDSPATDLAKKMSSTGTHLANNNNDVTQKRIRSKFRLLAVLKQICSENCVLFINTILVIDIIRECLDVKTIHAGTFYNNLKRQTMDLKLIAL